VSRSNEIRGGWSPDAQPRKRRTRKKPVNHPSISEGRGKIRRRCIGQKKQTAGMINILFDEWGRGQLGQQKGKPQKDIPN